MTSQHDRDSDHDQEPETSPPGTQRVIRRRRPFGRPVPIHVPLLATIPALALWSGNATAIRSMYPARIAIGCLLAAMLLTGIIVIVQRDLRRAGLIGSLTATTLCASGYVLSEPTSAILNLVLALIVVLVVVGAAVMMPERGMWVATVLLNVVAVSLVAANVGMVMLNRPGDFEAVGPAPTGATVGRDVWYIVPDRLPSEATLTSLGLDPGGFFDGLRERDFHLVEDAHTSYPQTDLSLAATWGLDYLGADPTTSGEPFSRLDDPLVGQLFDDAGYAYTHLGSWADFSATSRSADTVLTLQGAGEFWTAWEAGTLLPSLRYLMDVGTPHTVAYARQIEHGSYQLNRLERLAASEPVEPEFVLAHLILPHGPYVFDRNGSVRPRAADISGHEGYEDQLAFLSRRLETIIDLLQQREDPPIIVLMSDEGISPEDLESMMTSGAVDPSTYDATEIRHKTSILAAVYVPAGETVAEIPDDTSAINIARSVVGNALSIDLPPLKDRSYWWADSERTRLELLDRDRLVPIIGPPSS